MRGARGTGLIRAGACINAANHGRSTFITHDAPEVSKQECSERMQGYRHDYFHVFSETVLLIVSLTTHITPPIHYDSI